MIKVLRKCFCGCFFLSSILCASCLNDIKSNLNEMKSPDFVIVSPKNLRQRVWRFSDALPSALFGYKPPCSKVA